MDELVQDKNNAILDRYESDYSDQETIDDLDESWQSDTRNLRQRLNKIYFSGIYSDLTVDFGEVSIKVHKLILAIHSPVYETMFYGSLAYRRDTIEFKDVSLTTFKWIISYMYLGAYIIQDLEMAMDIYIFAHEKQMNFLVKRCSKFISERVTADNALKILEMGNLYDDEQLQLEATKKIFEKRDSVFASKDIGGMPKKLLMDIVSKDKIFCPDKDLFNYIYTWAKLQLQKKETNITRSAIREEMKDFFPYINFLLMNSDYFISNVMKTGILTAEEALAILDCTIKQTNKRLPSFVSMSKKERFIRNSKVTNYSITINRFSQCNMSFIYNNTQKVYTDKIIVFKTSEDIFISSIKLKPGCYIGSWKMHIMDFDERVLAISSNNYPPYNFEKMVPIMADKCYLCAMIGKGKRSKHGVVDYESSVGKISFVGISISCNVTINFTV